MCFGGGSGGSGARAAEKEAKRAREQEEERQARTRAAVGRVNSVFDSQFFTPQLFGEGLLGSDASFDPGATYYTEDGSVWNPNPGQRGSNRLGLFGRSTGPSSNRLGLFGRSTGPSSNRLGLFGRSTGPSTAASPTDPAEAFYKARDAGRLFSSQGSKDFFSGIKQDFIDYATPQLDDQFSDASRDLSFDLARSGLLNSSVRSDQGGRLQKLYDRNMQQITSQGLDRANQARNQVEDARGNLIMMAQATGDARGASNAAMSRASALSQPQGFSPIGQLFQDFTAGLGTQAAMERAEASSGGRFQSRYNTGLFGVPSDAARYTR